MGVDSSLEILRGEGRPQQAQAGSGVGVLARSGLQPQQGAAQQGIYQTRYDLQCLCILESHINLHQTRHRSCCQRGTVSGKCTSPL